MKGRGLFGLFSLPFTGTSAATTATSQGAARKVRTADTDRRRILQFIRDREHGATDDEMQQALEMAGDSQRPRRIELARAGCIEVREGMTRATRTGRPAVIWYFKKGLPTP